MRVIKATKSPTDFFLDYDSSFLPKHNDSIQGVYSKQLYTLNLYNTNKKKDLFN